MFVLDSGVIIGVAVLVLIVLIVLIVFICFKRKMLCFKRTKRTESKPQQIAEGEASPEEQTFNPKTLEHHEKDSLKPAEEQPCVQSRPPP